MQTRLRRSLRAIAAASIVAALLDLTVYTWPFLLPWFLPTILASGATRDGGALGMPAVSPLAAGLHTTYAWALAAAARGA